MRKLLLALAALAAMAIAVTMAVGSSHREAPGTMLNPSADDTDLYAFTAKDAPGALTVVGNWIPGQNPANGPNFFRFDDRARYYLNFDNNGDGKKDLAYRFKFTTSVRNKNSFLYALPGASGYDDPKLNVLQRYSITRRSTTATARRWTSASACSPTACPWRRRTSGRRRSRATSPSSTARSGR